MIKFDELFPHIYRKVGFNNKGSFQFVHSDYPVSIAQAEFDFIYNLVQEHDIESGLEIATGTGVSAMAFATSLRDKSRIGYILSIDSYIEEHKNSCNQYFGTSEIPPEQKGFGIIKSVASFLGVSEYVSLEVGRSPEDIPKIIESQERFDYVFIDAEHNTPALLKDLEAVSPYVKNGTFILMHDMHCFDRNQIDNKCSLLFGAVPKLAPNCGLGQSGYNLNYLKAQT